MLSHFKEKIKTQQANIFLCLVIILIALISFGAGRLTTNKIGNQPIIIQEPSTASVQQSIQSNQPANPTTQQSSSPETQPPGNPLGKFVGSINSNKYHLPDCPSAKKIAPENQIWFDSEQEAKENGYLPCKNCLK